MKFLQICHKPPFPPREGGAIAMYNLCQGLRALGHEVHVLAMSTHKQSCDLATVPEDFRTGTCYTLVEMDIRIKALDAFLNLFSSRSYNLARFDRPHFREAVRRQLLSQTYDAVILESLYSTACLDLVRSLHKGPVLLRSHNVEHHIWENLAVKEQSFWKRRYLRLLARRLRREEMAISSKVDMVMTISAEDDQFFGANLRGQKVEVLPFGIDFGADAFRQVDQPTQEELVLYHVGSMEWLPHQEAFRWFLDQVWSPLVRKRPGLRLCLAGHGMPDWVDPGRYPGLEVVRGYVDGLAYSRGKAIMVVPSFSGSGIRIKIVEGLAQGKVILTTENGALGMPYTQGVDMWVGESAGEWQDQILSLVDDLDKVRDMARAARRMAERQFDHVSAASRLPEWVSDLRSP